MRLHGDRDPHDLNDRLSDHGGGVCHTGAPNEVWSYGEEVYKICKKYLFLCEKLRPYIRECMERTRATGEPIIRPMFFDFPEDETCWTTEKQYMFGPDILVAPVLDAGARSKRLYLPRGSWEDMDTGVVYKGEQTIEVEAPLDIIPAFRRKDV